MLQMRPGCECCDRDLPADATDAWICSFECTFCSDCVQGPLGGRCPNCGGGFAPRPTRVGDALARNPASKVRVQKPVPACGSPAEGVRRLNGISHLTFVVRDLERMAVFLCEGLGATEVYDSAGTEFSLSREKFFLLGGVWLAAMEGEPPAQRSYQHVAFAVDEADLAAYQARLEAIGVDIRPPRPRVDGEGRSLYFHDFDNHLFELHAGTLQQRLARYAAGR